MINRRVLYVRDELNAVSNCFCLAKWYQVTIHLQNGFTHSCHHPFPHKIPLDELENNPSALHNTNWKKEQRKQMLNGIRPSECNYCWQVEDSIGDNISDRSLKSSESWALPFLDEARESNGSENVNPKYVEVSFGHGCNLKCMYCSPHVSSAIYKEIEQEGAFKSLPHTSLEYMKAHNLMPLSKDEDNPYVVAFWKWWPNLIFDLKVFRITGGEPLLNENTFKILESLTTFSKLDLTLAINTNLAVGDTVLEKFFKMGNKILEQKNIKALEIYTSVDAAGSAAEYIRNGLDYTKFKANVAQTLESLPNSVKVNIMCTFNILSPFSFKQLLIDLKELKLKYRYLNTNESRLNLDISILNDPSFMSIKFIEKKHLSLMADSLTFMQENARNLENNDIIFNGREMSQLSRIINIVSSVEETGSVFELRRQFTEFVKEYDARRGTDFKKVFPNF